jgi:hypothetical protein
MTAEKLRVHNPMGYPPQISQVAMAPRPSSLEGKTVYLVDCRFDDGDIFLQQMQNWFAEHMPSVKTVFAQKSGVYTEDDPKLFEEIKQNAAGVIVGVGH